MTLQDAASILREHLDICGELHALLLEENRLMRATGTAVGEDLLARKREFLPRLDASLARLREINASGATLSRDQEVLVLDGRKRLMQLLMLDRENERLMLRASLPPQARAAYESVMPGRVAKTYGRYASAADRSDPEGGRSGPHTVS